MSNVHRGLLPSFYLPKAIPVLASVVFLFALVANAWTLSARALAPGLQTAIPSNTIPAAASQSAGVVSLASIAAKTDETACTSTRPYRAPAIVDLTVAHDGLTAIVDQPYTYTVSASSLAGLRSGITNCVPRAQVAGDYHAITSRQIAWSYAFSQNSMQCTITNVRVGLHVTQLLPEFSPEPGTSQSVIDTWNTYHTNLVTHENGHVMAAKRYAAELLDRLNSLGTNDCATIKAQAKATVEIELNALNASDTDYDASTGHGATQGAVL